MLESTAIEGNSPVCEKVWTPGMFPSTTGHEKPCGNLAGPPAKAKYSLPPIVDQYCEGKVKSTPNRRVKETLKPFAYKRSEFRLWWNDGVPFA